MKENDNIKQTYIQLLIDSLGKKYGVLKELMQITISQQTLIDSDDFDEEQFLETITQKEKQIKNLSELDRGFELVYDRIRAELKDNSNKYKSEIIALKELVAKITDLSIKLQTLEKENKTKLEAVLLKKRKNIKNARLSNETVANYYKNMSGMQESPSYFYDKKN